MLGILQTSSFKVHLMASNTTKGYDFYEEMIKDYYATSIYIRMRRHFPAEMARRLPGCSADCQISYDLSKDI